MEDTLSSSINKALSSQQTQIDSHDEESAWTTYFDDLDFSNNNIEQQQQHSTYSCSSFSNPSLISDAASYIPWKVADIACASPNLPKNLSFKNSRTKGISYLDDSLEDTASSPVNSPKVSFLNQIDMNHIKTDYHMYSSLGKGHSFDHQNSKLQINEGKEMENYEFQDLKKRGFCLVPLSMLVNYLG